MNSLSYIYFLVGFDLFGSFSLSHCEDLIAVSLDLITKYDWRCHQELGPSGCVKKHIFIRKNLTKFKI